MRALLAVIVIAALGWAGYWWMGASAAQSGFAAWFDANEHAGRHPAPADITVPAYFYPLARLRRSTDWIRRPQVVGRWYRGFSYVWHLEGEAVQRIDAAPTLPRCRARWEQTRISFPLPPPHLDASGHPDARAVSDGFAEVYALLFANLQRPDLLSSTRHAIPGPAFRGVYLWDSAFIAQIWAREAVVEEQPRVLVVEDNALNRRILCALLGELGIAADTAASGAAALARLAAGPDDFDLVLVDLQMPGLDGFETTRRLRAEPRLAGLYFWAHPYESGVENAPRFSNTDESVLRNTATLTAVDLSSYVVLQLDALASLAERLDLADDKAAVKVGTKTLRALIEGYARDERDGLYYDCDGAGSPVRVATIASLLPLCKRP